MKTCQVCGAGDYGNNAETCAYCGEASWQEAEKPAKSEPPPAKKKSK